MEDLISVIVCTYNQEKTIARTLDSILMQQCHVAFEIVIGEDCSTDGTLSVCQAYREKRPDIIRLMANKKNKGLIDNYFDCILAARGKYIADCAGDDFWADPLKLEKEVAILESEPEVTLVHTDWNTYDESTRILTASREKPFTDRITDGKLMLESIITQTSVPVIHLCTSLYRTDIIRKALQEDEHLFRNKEFGCEDMQVAFTMALQGKIAFIPDRTLNYSQNRETVSCSKDDRRQFRFVRRTTALSHYLAQKHGLSSATVQDYFDYRIFALAMHALRAHDHNLYQETQECEKEWHTRRSLLTTCLFGIMRHEWLWSITLLGRRMFVTLKRVYR